MCLSLFSEFLVSTMRCPPFLKINLINLSIPALITSSHEPLYVDRVYVEGLVEALERLDLVVGLEVLDAVVDVLEGPLTVLRFLQCARIVLRRVVS